MAAADWKNCLREICAWRLLQAAQIVGSPGLHVEINATPIFHPKKHTGRGLPQQWVFGGMRRETKEVVVCLQCQIELLDTIQACVVPGSIMSSDTEEMT